MIPASPCTSWLGHKFEGRYSYTVPQEQKFGHFEGTPSAYEKMVRATHDKIYERDICVRCGATVEKTK